MTFRIVSGGASGIGKSYYLSMITNNTTSSLLIQPTIGVDYMTLKDNTTHLKIWDLSGKQEYAHLSRTYSKDADVVLLWYLNTESLMELRTTWLTMFKNKKFIICTISSCECEDVNLSKSHLCLGTVYMDKHDAKRQLIAIIKDKTNFIPPPTPPKRCGCTIM